MALVNEILVPRLSQMVQRLTGVKVPATAMPQLSPELQPVVVLEGPQFEHRVLGMVNSYAVGFAVTGVAAGPGFRLRLSGDSGAFAVVEDFWASIDGTGIVEWGVRAPGALDLAGAFLTPTIRDARMNQGAASICSIGDRTFGAESFPQSRVLINTSFNVRQSFLVGARQAPTVAARNSAFDIGANGVGQTLVGAVTWFERAIENSEVIKSA